jgi:hypothetical protein
LLRGSCVLHVCGPGTRHSGTSQLRDDSKVMEGGRASYPAWYLGVRGAGRMLAPRPKSGVQAPPCPLLMVGSWFRGLDFIFIGVDIYSYRSQSYTTKTSCLHPPTTSCLSQATSPSPHPPSARARTQDLHLEPLHQPFFVMGVSC